METKLFKWAEKEQKDKGGEDRGSGGAEGPWWT